MLPETLIVITETNTTIILMIQKHHLNLGFSLRGFTCKIFFFFQSKSGGYVSQLRDYDCMHLLVITQSTEK